MAHPAVTCPEGQARYQAAANIMVENKLLAVWEVRCFAPTHEVATLILAGKLVGEGPDGTFPAPEVIPVLCCGQRR